MTHADPHAPHATHVTTEPEVLRIVAALGLAPHPEGGFYRETFRATPRVAHPQTHDLRATSTAIYYLLPHGNFSAFHRVKSDEVWHHYDGGPLELHTVDDRDGHPHHEQTILGRDLANGQRPQHVVRAGVWQAARPLHDRFVLCGCTVAPGFEFADFELPHREALVARWPTLRAIVEALTRV